MCIFSPLYNTAYEWVEWMWRMSERSGVDMENERVEGWMWRMSKRSRVDVENERAGCMWTISEEDKILT